MALFYLIRHGHIPWKPGDSGLSELGRDQAQSVGKYLRQHPLDCIYSSPLLRARQTAEIIANVVDSDLQVEIDNRLRERMNWGDLPGQTWKEFTAEWNRATRERDYDPPGGQSAQQAAAAMYDFLSETTARYPQASIAAVSHGGIISDFLTDHFSQETLANLHEKWSLQHGESIKHCSVTTLRYEASGLELISLARIV